MGSAAQRPAGRWSAIERALSDSSRAWDEKTEDERLVRRQAAVIRIGAATVLMALAYGGREAMSRHKEGLRALAAWSSRILGGAFFLVGAMLFLELHHPIEAALLDVLPEWLQNLSVRY